MMAQVSHLYRVVFAPLPCLQFASCLVTVLVALAFVFQATSPSVTFQVVCLPDWIFRNSHIGHLGCLLFIFVLGKEALISVV